MAHEIVIVDYGMGNLHSVAKAVEFAGATAVVSDQPSAVNGAHKLILPGVGAFGAGMDGLTQRHLIGPLRERLGRGTPMLGICLGMQLLFSRSEESGERDGLGVIAGSVKHFANGQRSDAVKVPHMGWNQIMARHQTPDTRHMCPLLEGIPDGAFMYFVHSYYPEPSDPSVVAANTSHGVTFASVVWKGSIYATQFHPEKSQQLGLRLLRNFVELAC